MAWPRVQVPAWTVRRWGNLSEGRQVALAALTLGCITFGLRAWPVFSGDAVADVATYQHVGRIMLDGHFSELYALPYPYPPLWMYFEASSQWISQRFDAGFATVIKLPILAADIAMVIFALLILRARGMALGRAFLWTLVIAMSPVIVLISGFHGQFDSMAIALLIGAAYFGEEAPEGRRSLILSAVLLSLAIALKGFPALVLPFFLWRCCRDLREAALFATAALLPTAVLLAPFALVGFDGVRHGLLEYSGVIDHGWASLIRGWLARTTDTHWTGLPGDRKEEFADSGRIMFLIAWTLATVWFGPRQRVLDSSLLVFLLFFVIFPGISSQYLLWLIPLGVIAADLLVLPYTVAATAALIGFYMWFWPQIVDQPGAAFTRNWARDLLYWSDWALWLTTILWAFWRLVPRSAPASYHSLPRPAVVLLAAAIPVGAVIFSLQATHIFKETRVILEAF